jgi:ankyrin repeat protein
MQSPQEQLDVAIRSGDAERARALLTQHADLRASINEPRFDFDSPAIHQAKHHLPLVDVLLEFGADINARSSFWAGGFGILEWNLTLEQARPLIARGAQVTVWAAAGLGLIEELRTILRDHPEAARERGGDGKTALHCAATTEIAALLIDNGAELNARDTDHAATPLQYLIGDEAIARVLISHGAEVDIFAAARLGDAELVRQCLRRDPASAEAILNAPPFTAPGGHIYGWTLGDSTPAQTARRFGHADIADLILSQATARTRFLDALWCADGDRARRELDQVPQLMQQLQPRDRSLVAEAAWAHRPDSIRLMLELGFDPHVPTVHRSTPLDRASFHGYADIVALLLRMDPHPPLTFQNEFGGLPLGACIYGATQGWKTGHPQDHARTLQLLLEAGSPLDPAVLPTGDDSLDAVLRAWLAHPGTRT